VAPMDSRSSTARRDDRGEGTQQAERTYVLDTSVLLSDPRALFRFAEHAVVIPVIVITELESKRNDPEIGYFARQALRLLDQLREEHERLDFPIEVGDAGGTLRVELNHSSMAALPNGLQLGDNDSRILAVALNLSTEGLAVTVVSKDMPLRVKAASIGLQAEEYRAELAVDSGWTGMADVTLSSDQMADLYDTETLQTRAVQDLPVNTGVVLHSDRGSALGRVTRRGTVHLVRGDREVFGLKGRSAEQRLAIDLLLDREVGIVSLGGSAGTCRCRRSRSAPRSRRCWRSSSTARSWCSGRCTRWAARSSATCRATPPRR
jgi:PhoH-like ATPase